MEKPPLFCTYKGTQGGKLAQGWCVLKFRALIDAEAVEELTSDIEHKRAYDEGSLLILSFQRLETA